jgi:hypothetical protein
LKLKAKTLKLLTFFALGNALDTRCIGSVISGKFKTVFGPTRISTFPTLLEFAAIFFEIPSHA